MSFQPSHSESKLHQPKDFRFDSVTDSHEWSDLYVHPFAEAIGPDAVPVIELTDPNLIEKIGKACEEWGVFILGNHGIEPELLNQFSSQIHRLFALPVEDKLKVAKDDYRATGYGGISSSRFFPKFTWSEGFSIIGSPLDHAQKLWPDDCSSFCEAIERYKEATKPLGCRLINAMLLSLGLSEEEINSSPLADSSKIFTVMHINSYPACTDPDRVLGLVPHTDSGLITILYQNGVSGLQVLRRKDDVGPARWVTVPEVQDTLVVSVGDIMHVLSNGRFYNVMHRAIVNNKDQRISAAHFLSPPVELKVEPLSKLIGTNQRPIYKSVTWQEHLKLREMFYDKALQSIKISEN